MERVSWRAFAVVFASRVRTHILAEAARLQGRGARGLVQNRDETEDVEIDLDASCERIFQEGIPSVGFSVRIVSEHHPEGYGPKDAEFTCFLDPFDGSDQFRRGIREAWFVAWSVVDKAGTPIFGFCLDVLGSMLYLASQERVEEIFLGAMTGRIVSPSQGKQFSRASTVAAYMGRWQYLDPFARFVGPFLAREELRGAKLFSNGGSFIYAYLASGLVTAYIMIGEPRDEITPGVAFVRFGGLFLGSIRGDGSVEEYDPIADTASRVPFFIAACNRDMAEAFVRTLSREQLGEVHAYYRQRYEAP